MKKPGPSLIMALTIILSLAACGQQPSVVETTSPTEIETTAPEVRHWEITSYVDDFGDPTDETYYQGTFDGTFSNSATDESELTAVFIMNDKPTKYDSNIYTIRLLEYGDHTVDMSRYSPKDIVIKLKNQNNGEVIESHADYISNKDICLERGNPMFVTILDNLFWRNEMTIVVELPTGEKYIFDVDSDGL